MAKIRKTQFAIRKLTTGTGILLLSIGMGINLSSKKVSASEINSAQTTETIQTETEPTTDQVESATPTQEAGNTSTVETTSSVEEKTVTEVPAETITEEEPEVTEPALKTEPVQNTTVTDSTSNDNNGSVNTETQAPATQPETEKPGQDTAVADNVNNNVNTETQKPESTPSTTQPETEKVEESEKAPVKNESNALPEKEETDSDKSEKEDQKDDLTDVSILPDGAKPVDKNDENDKGDWLDQYRPNWDKINNKTEFPGWENIINGNIVFNKTDTSPWWDPRWEANINKDITITQTVNGKDPQDIKINYDVVVTIKPHFTHIMGIPWWTQKFEITDIKINSTKYENNKSEFDAVTIPTAPDGFKNEITGTVTNDKGENRNDYTLTGNFTDTEIKTDLSGILNKILQRGENVTFNYDINHIAIKEPTWADIIDSDAKTEWNDLFQNIGFVQGTDGNWTSSVVTLNKVITQNINGLKQENTQTIHLTKDVTITIQREGNTNQFKIISVNNPEWTSSGNLGSINISKPGYSHNVSASISGTISNLAYDVNNGYLTTNLDFSKLENNNTNVTIKYEVSYTPNFGDIQLPNGMDKDDLNKKDDYTWTGTITNNKVINQIVVNGSSNSLTLSQTVSVTVTWKDDKWTVSDPTIVVTVKDDNPLNINKPGYNHNVTATVDGAEFKDFTVGEDGTISITKDAWNKLNNNDTIKYEVTHTPNFGDIKLPEGMDKDDLKPGSDGTWTGSITNNKVINQTVVNGGSNQLTLSQTISVTVTWKNDKWNVSDPKIEVTVKDDNPLNVNKPGYNHNVTATVDGAEFKDFTIAEDGTISITDKAWNSLKDKDTINYEVTYTVDQDKVKLPEGLDKDDITDWTENSDGTVTVTINKNINQNVLNGGSNKLTLSQKATFTLAWSDTEQKLIATVKSLEEVSVTEDNPLNINKPGYHHSVSATINGTEFNGFTVENGNIVVDSKTWTDLTKVQNGTIINYKVTHTPNWDNVKWPEDVDKDEIKDWIEDSNGTWTGSTTIDKVINQTIVNGGANTLNWSQKINVTLTVDKDGNWTAVAVKNDPVITITGDQNLNVNKPGYNHNVTATVNGTEFKDFQIENGNIVLDKDIWNSLKKGETININYEITYTPNFGDVKLPDGINKDDLTENPDGSWTGSTTIDKVINQNVNIGDSNTLSWSQKVTVTLTVNPDGTWTAVTVKDEPITNVDKDLNINKPGYNHNITASIGNSEFKDFTVDNAGNIVLDKDIWNSLKKNEVINIEYKVTYTPNFGDVKLPDGINKDDLTENPDGSWTGSTTIDKVINQNVNIGGSNTLNWSQKVTVTLTVNPDGTWTAVTVKDDPTTTITGDQNLNVNKPGYNHNITASIGNSEFKNFTIDNAGNIVLDKDIWNSLKKGETININYDVTYTPNFGDVKLPDGITKDDLTENPDGSWTGSTTIDKVINQTVNTGGSNTLNWSQKVTVTLTVNPDGTWTAVTVKDDPTTTITGDQTLSVNKPGYNHNVTATINGTEFKDFTVDNAGNIVLNKDIWNSLKKDESINIEYKVTYTPNFGDVKLPDGITKDDLTENPDGSWTGSTTIDKVINQNVNIGGSNTLNWSQKVTVTLTVNPDGTWTAVTVKDDPTTTIAGDQNLNVNKPGYNHNVTATVNGVEFKDFTVDNAGNIVLDKDIWNSLKKDESINIEYQVTYTPNFGDVKLPDGINKDDLTENPDGSWTGSTTIDKVITQTWANGSNKITLSQKVDVTLTLKDGKWNVDVVKGNVTVKDDNPININKPNHDHTVSATVNGTEFKDFTVGSDGTISINTNAWNALKDGDTINYEVTYTPIKPQPDTVTPPNKDDNDIWSDDVTDKEKDDIIDKIESGGLTWEKNEDGTWSASVDFNKQLSQSVTGNMINNPSNIKLDVTKKVTLIAELKGDKFHITSVKSGKWTSEGNLDHKLPASDNKYDISATVNNNDHAGLKEVVENTNTIPGLNSELIQSIINSHEYGSLLQLSYVINANSGSADPNKPAEPDTPNVDPDMGVTPETPSTPDIPSNPGDNNNPGNTPGSGDSTENTDPKPEVSPKPEDETTTIPGGFIRPLPEKVDKVDDESVTQDSDPSKSESNKNAAVTSNKTTGKKTFVTPLSESKVASKNDRTDSQHDSAMSKKEAALPQTGEGNDNMTTMGIIMAGLASALTTLGMAIKKKKD